MRLDPWIRDHALLGATIGGGAPAAFFLVTGWMGNAGFGFHHPLLYVLLTGVAGTALGATWGLAQRTIARYRPDGLGWLAILLASPAAGFVWGLGAGVAGFAAAFDPLTGRFYDPDASFAI